MKQHIKSLPHHPKRIILISLVIALVIGTLGYIKINKKVSTEVINNSDNTEVAISPAQNLTLGFLSGGRIRSVSVKAGDEVKKGQVLASLDAGNTIGSLDQAKAAYQLAEANYQKIINGATGSAVDVAKAAVNTAETNLDGINKQENLLVANAHATLLNSTITATSADSDSSLTSPAITGTYTKDTEGKINFTVNQAGSGSYVTFSGLVNGTTPASTTSPQQIGDSGLYIKFSSIPPYAGTTWEIDIPNKNASNYLTNYNAYQTALETKNQAISNAQASLDQAKASLAALVTAARPEDVAMAQAQVNNAGGAVEIAQAAFQNTIITAPSDGTVVSISIAPGQIAIANAPVIQFTSLTNSK